jgi:hypothetical protein
MRELAVSIRASVAAGEALHPRQPDQAGQMASLNDITRDAVLKAIDEYDELGQDAFLSRHGFGLARSYFLIRNGKTYDSKAIVGVAHSYLPGRQPLPAGKVLVVPPSARAEPPDPVERRRDAHGAARVGAQAERADPAADRCPCSAAGPAGDELRVERAADYTEDRIG